MIRHSLDIVDADSRKEVAGSVVLTGGTTKMKGFKERLATELEQLPHVINIIFFDIPPKYPARAQSFLNITRLLLLVLKPV